MSEDRVSLTIPPAPPNVTPQDFVVPSETVPLPSEGRTYPVDSTLSNAHGVEIKSMTARDEDILTSRALIKSGKVIGALLKSCILDKTIDPETMLVGDRNAILIGIRITGYGPEYPIKAECPNCASSIEEVVNLGELPIKRFPEDVTVTPGSSEFGFFCTFKLFTGLEERDLLGVMEKGRKSGVVEELVTTRLKLQITAINGDRDANKIAAFVRNMPARDSRDLRAYIDRITPGVELKANISCPSCDYEGLMEVPLSTDFFWPQAK
jgi:hypothetical protein